MSCPFSQSPAKSGRVTGFPLSGSGFMDSNCREKIRLICSTACVREDEEKGVYHRFVSRVTCQLLIALQFAWFDLRFILYIFGSILMRKHN